jgi:DNA ligase-1
MPYCQGLFDEDLNKILNEIGPFVLDAEQFSGSWEETMNARKAGENSAKQNMGLKAFFIMPYDDWIKQSTKITMKQNRENIKNLFEKISPKKLVISTARIVHNIDEIKSMLKEVTTPGFEGQPKGYEGLILKRANATYQWKRVMDWCKVKNFYDVDMVVLEVLPGRPNTKFSGKMGKVRARGYLEDGTLVEGLVGSGFNDEQRQFYFNNPHEIVGKTIVGSYQEVTKPSAKSPIPNLRFCTFVRVRDDKTVILEDD